MISHIYHRIIIDNLQVFVTNLSEDLSNLLSLLLAEEVITYQQYAEVKSSQLEHDGIQKLLLLFLDDDMISPDAKFEVFLAKVVDCGHRFVLNYIISKYQQKRMSNYYIALSSAIGFGHSWIELRGLFEDAKINYEVTNKLDKDDFLIRNRWFFINKITDVKAFVDDLDLPARLKAEILNTYYISVIQVEHLLDALPKRPVETFYKFLEAFHSYMY